MRILFLTHYFPPETNAPATRSFEHCRQWVQKGHEVTVLTCAPNQPTGILYDGYQNKLWQEEGINGIRVVRVWTYLAANSGFARRTANFVSYMLSALIAAPFLPKADIIIATSPQFFCGLAGYGVSILKRTRWVLEVRDLWPASILAVGAMKNSRVIRFLEAVERFAYRHADHIVALTHSFREHIEAMGVDRSKIEVITNGVDLALFETIGRDQRLARDLGLEGKFVAAYFGTHGMAHGLQTVLEAAELTRQNDQIRYLLVGNGADRERLLALKNEKELDNLIMLPRQDRAKMPALWSLCDVGLVLLKKSDVFRTVVPSKIFEAMAMRKPMILGVEGECQELLARYDCALPIEPEDAPALADAVLHLAGQDWQATVEMGARGRKAVAQHFDRSVLAERYLALLARLVGDPDPESANAGEAVVQLDRRPDSPDVGEASYQSERVSRERRA